ncbi:MAG: hypothetical protein Q9218_008097 [Villophora microphyllina]
MNWLAFLLALAFCKAASIPADSAPITNLTQPGTSISAFPDKPDANWDYLIDPKGPKLDETASLMVCVRAMQDLALANLDQPIREQLKYIEPEFPSVTIVVVPNTVGTTTVRFALWTILSAIQDMILSNRFQTSEVRGRYKRYFVGIVRFSVTSPGPLATPQQLDASSNDDRRLDCIVQYLDKAIERKDVFLTMFFTLVVLASQSKTEPLNVVTLRTLGRTVQVSTIWNRDRTARAAATQPWNAENLILLVGYLPRILVQTNKFYEMNIEVKNRALGGVVIGRGVLRSSPRTGLTGTS